MYFSRNSQDIIYQNRNYPAPDAEISANPKKATMLKLLLILKMLIMLKMIQMLKIVTMLKMLPMIKIIQMLEMIQIIPMPKMLLMPKMVPMMMTGRLVQWSCRRLLIVVATDLL